MSNEILTPKPLSHNQMAQLAEILEHNFQYHRKQQTLFHHEFISTLKTVVGLGFTAIMVDCLYLPTHQPDFILFLDYFSADAKHDSILPVALAAAKIMDTAAHVFRSRDLSSDHYNAFAKTLQHVVNSGLLDSDKKQEESQRLIQQMIRRSYY